MKRKNISRLVMTYKLKMKIFLINKFINMKIIEIKIFYLYINMIISFIYLKIYLGD